MKNIVKLVMLVVALTAGAPVLAIGVLAESYRAYSLLTDDFEYATIDATAYNVVPGSIYAGATPEDIFGFTPTNFSFIGISDASAGVMHVGASALIRDSSADLFSYDHNGALVLNPAGVPDFLQVIADASTQESFQATGTSLQFIRLTAHVDGYLSGNGFLADAYAEFGGINQYGYYDFGGGFSANQFSAGPDGRYSADIYSPYFLLSACATTITTRFETTVALFRGDNLNVSADFTHTFRLTGVSGYSKDMAQVAITGLTGSSGYDYSPLISNPTVGGVPEPATWALLLIGFVASGTALRRHAVPSLA